jgi:hypothetical protein
MHHSVDARARRSFLSRFGTGMAAVGAALAGGTSAVQAQGAGAFQPTRHDEDNWLDLPGKHRFIFDTITPVTLTRATAFGNNYLAASTSSYGLTDADTAMVIIVRFQSAPMGYDNSMWAKYGAGLADAAGIADASKPAPTTNPQLLAPAGATTLDALLKRGVRLAVCALATRVAANAVVAKHGGNAADIVRELSEHLVTNGRMVPSGIVTFSRAQERGFAGSSVV